MKLLLAVPTGGTPTVPFLDSLRNLQIPPATSTLDRMTIVGNFVPGQRELAARRATTTDADVLVMFDDDMIVPPDTVLELVAALSVNPQLAVVGALYYSRDGIHPMVADRWRSADTTTAAIPAYDDALTYCDAVGFGCVAIRVSALHSMPSPYFSTQVYVEERAARVRICNEDYLFCEKVRQAGWLVAFHAGVRCKHFDRATNVAQPREWEDPATTRMERMIVVDPGPTYRLVPYDTSIATQDERHESVAIDYIIVA